MSGETREDELLVARVEDGSGRLAGVTVRCVACRGRFGRWWRFTDAQEMPSEPLLLAMGWGLLVVRGFRQFHQGVVCVECRTGRRLDRLDPWRLAEGVPPRAYPWTYAVGRPIAGREATA